ncbi:transglycosylase SLT domain-containing protein [Cellulomonas soli]|uniref:Transglycosylase SLT domain-containing protein n=1 Tax=Cellulomonas soli TaxID=931535 RepID=A0A512P9D7_9CELL|nr:transglycosylase SLT domain-containing protein [Cellulomonas soli]NYI60303.1 hypothetical protein [Cellulomonas soli]GEP67813.1 hypothetical protein CSO01_05280 [Cellulomonas soli]
MIGKLTLGALGILAVPALAIVTALGVAFGTHECLATAGGGTLSDDAPVPVAARGWVAEVRAGCPDLPEPWIAAVMAQESGFRPDAYADDANGGTWGLFQLNATIWQNAYGHPWSADLNGNGTWDVQDPDIHATVAGRYLCDRLTGVRQIRTEHPDWASSTIPVLDALIIAHNAGESRLRTYPTIPATTRDFIANVAERVAAWTADPVSGAQAENPEPAPDPSIADASGTQGSAGCVPDLGRGDVRVPAGTPVDVATAVRNAMAYVGVTSGWTQLCDRLACRAYGYLGSGYPSATAHWHQMLTEGHAHPDDLCPPLGSFVFFDTGRPFGHVSIVVQADPGRCDPTQIKVTSNGAFDAATGNHGGVYLLTLAQLTGFYRGGGYLGWSDPVCRGALLPADTIHPAPPGR